MNSALWTAVFVWSITSCLCRCPSNVLLLYRMVLHAEWSDKTFPKQYPEYRPHAQWSIVAGRSHDENDVLWRVGQPASDALKQFTETGRADLFLREAKQGVLSEFFSPPLNEGVGETGAMFFADHTHSKVSFVCRIIPSPDWFIGLDSYDLCRGGRFSDTVKIDLWPLDAGTDNGYTFTAPNWATEPRANVTRIRSQSPDHPAASFYYPELDRLPRIATVTFRKLKEFYQMKAESSIRDIKPRNETEINNDLISDLKNINQKEEKKIRKERRKKKGRIGDISSLRSREETTIESNALAKKQYYKSKSCRVSEWSEWGACSNQCGFGDQVRKRKVIHFATKSGRPCPPLEESKWCKSSEGCGNKTSSFFRWQ